MNRGRPLEFDPEAALEAAMQLFWTRGFEATSLQDLLDSMGIARSSFYQAFGSKQEVFLRGVERYRDWLAGELRRSMESADSGLDFIEDTLKSVAGDTKCADGRRGCLVFNSAAEFGQRDPEVAGRVAASTPIGMATASDSSRAPSVSSSEAGSLRASSSATGWPVEIDTPRSPRSRSPR